MNYIITSKNMGRQFNGRPLQGKIALWRSPHTKDCSLGYDDNSKMKQAAILRLSRDIETQVEISFCGNHKGYMGGNLSRFSSRGNAIE